MLLLNDHFENSTLFLHYDELDVICEFAHAPPKHPVWRSYAGLSSFGIASIGVFKRTSFDQHLLVHIVVSTATVRYYHVSIYKQLSSNMLQFNKGDRPNAYLS